MFKTVSPEDFIEEFRDYPSYDNVRKIASVVDGLKNSSRKVVYYCLKHNITKPIKTSQIKSQIENETQYLHGDITGVVESLAKNYVGSNNMNLLEPHGNFGTALVKESSASRYTFTKPSSNLYRLFDKDDLEILDRQYFEGDEIEPVYLMPQLPLLLINGSEGISSGFAQRILGRNPEEIEQAIKDKIKPQSKKILKYNGIPCFMGFNGTIESGDSHKQWIIKGSVQRVNTTTVNVTAVPPSYDLAGYLKVLDKLEDDGIIKGYEDNSELDFNFTVNFTREKLKSLKTDDDILKCLKLTKTVTENYTVQNESNRVVEFESVNELLDYFIDIRLKFLSRKIQHQIDIISDHMNLLQWKRNFIQKVMDNELVINRRKKSDIVKDLDALDDVGQVDNSYDYLLNMSLLNMTAERIKKLDQEIKQVEKSLNYYQKVTPSKLYLDQLNQSSFF